MQAIRRWAGSATGRTLAFAAVITAAAALVMAGCGDLEATDPPSSASDAASTQIPETPTATTDVTPPDPAPALPPAPVPAMFSGTGQKVINFEVRSATPLVVKGTHSGSSNFIVEAIPRSTGGYGEGLFNEIGSYSGQTVWVEPTVGKHRLKVDADGPWTLTFTRPETMKGVALLPGAVKGTGATAVIVRSTKEFNAVVKGQHQGDSNFIVELVGTGDTSGREGLFNEIGAFGGETVVDIPEGRMLLSVQANGPWTLAFSE